MEGLGVTTGSHMKLTPTIPSPSFWKGRKVLLTGHTGFKGSWLALWLLELGAEVTGLALPPVGDLSLFSELSLSGRVRHNVLDIRDQAGLKNLVVNVNPEVVFHLAAQPLVRLSYEEPIATWEINVLGTIYLLEALRACKNLCSAVMITTDKVYKNKEWVYGYRETDSLGGHDPYSSSKAASEIAIESWRSSFCGEKPYQTPYLRIASARAGNVIGGGDWARDRIIPDMVRSLIDRTELTVRNPSSTRPWQHVLEPLSGYLRLAESLYQSKTYAKSFNFGPPTESNRNVSDLLSEAFKHWTGKFDSQCDPDAPHEAGLLNLSTERAYHELNWSPCWDFSTTVQRTVNWYQRFHNGQASALHCCLDDLTSYQSASLL